MFSQIGNNLFSGANLGWASLVYILKDLGYFKQNCQVQVHPTVNVTETVCIVGNPLLYCITMAHGVIQAHINGNGVIFQYVQSVHVVTVNVSKNRLYLQTFICVN